MSTDHSLFYYYNQRKVLFTNWYVIVLMITNGWYSHNFSSGTNGLINTIPLLVSRSQTTLFFLFLGIEKKGLVHFHYEFCLLHHCSQGTCWLLLISASLYYIDLLNNYRWCRTAIYGSTTWLHHTMTESSTQIVVVLVNYHGWLVESKARHSVIVIAGGPWVGYNALFASLCSRGIH